MQLISQVAAQLIAIHPVLPFTMSDHKSIAYCQFHHRPECTRYSFSKAIHDLNIALAFIIVPAITENANHHLRFKSKAFGIKFFIAFPACLNRLFFVELFGRRKTVLRTRFFIKSRRRTSVIPLDKTMQFQCLRSTERK